MTDGSEPNDEFEPAPLSAADEIEVSALLAQLPDPVLPDDVETRIAAALAHDPATAAPPAFPHGTTVLPTHDDEKPVHARRHPRVLQGAAALVALALIGAAVIGITHATSGSDGSGDTGTTAAAAPPPITASGREYTADNLADDVQLLLNPSAPVAASATQPDAEVVPKSDAGTAASAGTKKPTSDSNELAPTDGGDDGGGTTTTQSLSGRVTKSPSAAQIAAITSLIRTPASRDRCVQTLAGAPGVTPVAIDIATFDGRPAAVIVLPHAADPTEVEVWVVGSTCSDKDSPFPFQYAQVERP